MSGATRSAAGQQHPRATPDVLTIVLTAAIAAVAVLLLASRIAGLDAQPLSPGLRTGGQLTSALLPLAKLANIVASVSVAGALLAALLVAPAHPAGSRVGAAIVVRLRPLAAAWALAALATALLSVSDIAGAGVGDVVTSGALLENLWTIAQARALVIAAGFALVVAAAASLVTGRRHGAAALLGITAMGAAAPAFTGHSAAASNEFLAVASLVIHVLAATAWIGGLLGLVVLCPPDAVIQAVPRFSKVALACYVLVAGSGLVNAATRLNPLTTAFSTSYGWLVLGKVVAAVVLGALGWQHRRVTIPAITRGQPRAFARLAGAELIVMAATLGLAVALSQAQTP